MTSEDADGPRVPHQALDSLLHRSQAYAPGFRATRVPTDSRRRRPVMAMPGRAAAGGGASLQDAGRKAAGDHVSRVPWAMRERDLRQPAHRARARLHREGVGGGSDSSGTSGCIPKIRAAGTRSSRGTVTTATISGASTASSPCREPRLDSRRDHSGARRRRAAGVSPGLGYDITDAKEAEAVLRRSKDELKRLVEVRSADLIRANKPARRDSGRLRRRPRSSPRSRIVPTSSSHSIRTASSRSPIRRAGSRTSTTSSVRFRRNSRDELLGQDHPDPQLGLSLEGSS